MKRFITTFAFLVFCAGCKDSTPEDMDKYTMDYSIGKNQFGVVVAEDDGITKGQARKYAMQRAAEIAYDHGYQYFTINSESQVVVMRTEKGSPNQDMPRNLYYERIQTSNFGRDHLQNPEMHPASRVPGYQIEFSCQEEKPFGRSYDVCNYGVCD